MARCSWCQGELEKVYEPDSPAEQVVGVCPDDGIVYVEDGVPQ